LLPLLAIVPPPAPVVRDRGVPARGPGGVWAAQRPGGHATVRRAVLRNVAGALATALIHGAVRGWEHQEVSRYPVQAAT
jgi:hypothetical protein